MTTTTVKNATFTATIEVPAVDKAAVKAVLDQFAKQPVTFATQVDIINALLPLFTPQITVDVTAPEVSE